MKTRDGLETPSSQEAKGMAKDLTPCKGHGSFGAADIFRSSAERSAQSQRAICGGICLGPYTFPVPSPFPPILRSSAKPISFAIMIANAYHLFGHGKGNGNVYGISEGEGLALRSKGAVPKSLSS